MTRVGWWVQLGRRARAAQNILVALRSSAEQPLSCSACEDVMEDPACEPQPSRIFCQLDDAAAVLLCVPLALFARFDIDRKPANVCCSGTPCGHVNKLGWALHKTRHWHDTHNATIIVLSIIIL